ncbi:MAG TPA: alkaline phosphatase family protein [Candidatus Tumulicola sp.]|nr:alkaline phosphatase family protein [Candidatus Tumulicola sp.]
MPSLPGMRPSSGSGGHIAHVVILIQENRTYDNLFATYPGGDGVTRGKNHLGQWVPLRESKLVSPLLPSNGYKAFVVQYDGGKVDGWDLVYVNDRSCPKCIYKYVNPAYVQPYWNLAQQYVLADHMFATSKSGSFNGHQDLIRGDTAIDSSESLIDFPTHSPWGCDAPSGTTIPLLKQSGQYVAYGPYPCESYETLRDLLDAKSVSWKYYTPELEGSGLAGVYWDAFDAIKAVRNGPEWNANISSPETNIFKDIAKGRLPAVAWVVPDGKNSDHSGFGRKDTGPSWVAQVVNAIGASPYWSSTAIVVVWDDWGGWYDHEPPPQLDYMGLGFRVPMLIVSPYAKPGYVSHTQYEFGSILKFVEDTFGLGRLGTTDGRANSIADAFDFSQRARKFRPIEAKYSRQYFERERPSNVPVDDQ